MVKTNNPQNSLTNGDDLLFHEDRDIAREIFNEAWEKAQAEGVSSAMLAGVMISEILDQLVEESGEWAAVAVIKQLAQMEVDGNFIPVHSLQ